MKIFHGNVQDWTGDQSDLSDFAYANGNVNSDQSDLFPGRGAARANDARCTRRLNVTAIQSRRRFVTNFAIIEWDAMVYREIDRQARRA